jgi:hypothetical protein
MRHNSRWSIAGLALLLAAPLGAQTTGMPSFNAPYRGFQRSELGAVVSFPGPGGTAFEGEYRYARSRFDIGLRVGMWDPGAAKTRLMIGGEARQRVITHSTNFPLDGALIAGIGAQLVSGGSGLLIPVGLSLGRRVDLGQSAGRAGESRGSSISIVPYVQPTAFFSASLGSGGGSDLNFTLGLGADVRLTRTFDVRFSAGIGDLDGISLAAVWVH